MSTYTTDLKLENPVPFDPAVRNLWGPILNTGRSLLDTAIVGELSLSVAGAANVVLTQVDGGADQSRNAHYNLSGVLTGNVVVLWPALKRKFSVTNSTSGAFTLSCGVDNGGVPLGLTVTIPQGATMMLMSDGTDVRSRFSSAPAFDATNNQNAATVLAAQNASTGAAATAILRASNGTSKGELIHHGTAFTTAGVLRQNGTALIGNGAGGLTIGTSAAQPIYFAYNSVQTAQFTGTGWDFAISQNGSSVLGNVNANAGVAARAQFEAGNGTSAGALIHFGSSFTTSGVNRQNGTMLNGGGAGGLTLNTGANQPIYFGVNAVEIARMTAAGLGIGMDPTNVLDITKSTNGNALAAIVNGDAGAAARAAFSTGNGIANTFMFHYGTAYTPAAMNRADGGQLMSNGAGGLSILTGANQPIYFGVNSVEIARITATGLGIGGAAPTQAIDADISVNGVTAIRVDNDNAGVATQAGYILGNNLGDNGYLWLQGGSFTTSGITRQDGVILTAGGAGGLTLATSANQPVYFGVNGTQVAQFSSTAYTQTIHTVYTPTTGAIGPGDDLTITGIYHRFTGGGTVSGVAGGVDGRIIILSSVGTIAHEDTGSAAANRFDLPGSSDITLSDDGTATFIYNGATSRWNLIAFSG